DRKSTRLNSSHLVISYAVFCLKKKKVTRIIKMHQDATVRQIGFKTALARMGDFHRHRFVVGLEDKNVLELVSLFSIDVNFPARKLIDHLVAAEERHGVARREIKNRAPHFL